MSDADWVETMWSDAARAAYRSRADALLVTLRAHVEMTLAREGRERETAKYFDSQCELGDAAMAFVDAEFDWCGSAPLALLRSDDDREDEQDWDDEEDLDGDAPVLSVEGRWDFQITDEIALVDEGRRAYLAAWPNATADDAVVRAHDALSAAGEILHDDNIAALAAATGLEPYQHAVRFWTHSGRDKPEDEPVDK